MQIVLIVVTNFLTSLTADGLSFVRKKKENQNG